MVTEASNPREAVKELKKHYWQHVKFAESELPQLRLILEALRSSNSEAIAQLDKADSHLAYTTRALAQFFKLMDDKPMAQ